MKKGLAAVAWLSLVTLAHPAWTFECPTLIGEGRDLLAKASLSGTQSSKIKALLDAAEKLHNGGQHGEAVEKANQALDLLKKK